MSPVWRRSQLRTFWTLVNVATSLVLMSFAAVRMTIAIPPAIRRTQSAVAPLSSLRNVARTLRPFYKTEHQAISKPERQ
jgi:hypothetical protein